MPRRPNVLPTTIYWLIDVRPDTVLKCSEGRPFYCGKTIFDVRVRLARHRTSAAKHPNRSISRWLNECGEFVHTRVIEIVPVNEDWSERERHWIATLRNLYPDCANETSGGQGTPGIIHSTESRAKMSAAKKGKKLSPEHIAKIKAIHTGRKRPAETGRKISDALKRSPKSIEYHASKVGTKHSAETRAKMSIGVTGKKREEFSPEHKAKISAALKNRYFSPEHRAKISAAKTGKKRAPFTNEHLANLSAGQLRRVARSKAA